MEPQRLTFLTPVTGLVAGIIIFNFLPHPFLFAIASIALAIVCFIFVNNKKSNPAIFFKYKSIHFLWIGLLFLGIGLVDSAINNPPAMLNPNYLKSINHCSGIVLDSKTYADGDRFVIKVHSLVDSLGRQSSVKPFKIYLRTDGLCATQGDEITFQSNIRPFEDSGKNKEYAKRMRDKGIHYYAYAKTDKIIKTARSTNFRNYLFNARDNLEVLIERSSLNRDTGDFIISLLLGDKSFLANDIKDTFSSAGIAHILALSGLHVAIILSAILLLLFPLSLFGYHKARYLLALSVVWGYILFTGMAPSTIRAGIMATFLIGAIILQRKNSSMNALLGAVFIILLVDPSSISDVGFQLSVVCVASIILFVNPINTISRKNHPRLFKIINVIVISLVTTLSSWVLISYYFKNVPLLFLPANLLLLPIIPLIVWLGLIFLVFLCFGIDIKFISSGLNLIYDFFVGFADSLSLHGKYNIQYEADSLIVILWLMAVLFMAFAIYSKRKKVNLIFSLSFFLISIILIPIKKTNPNDYLLIKHDYTAFRFELFTNEEVSHYRLERKTISRFRHGDIEVITVDCPVDLQKLKGLHKKEENPATRRYLLLGSGTNVKNLISEIDYTQFEKVLFHASINKAIYSDILEKAKEKNQRSLYSLREEGSLEISF